MISVIFFTVSFPYFGLLKSNDDLVFTGLWPLLYVNIVFVKIPSNLFLCQERFDEFPETLTFFGKLYLYKF